MHLIKRAFTLLLTVSLLSSLVAFSPVFAKAEDSSGEVVRVGYFINSGFQDYAEDGTYSGYGYEYLQNLAVYTGWKYEYVHGSWAECLEWLETGEIDLMGFVQKTAAREEIYGYPDLDSGYNATKLLTNISNRELAEDAYEDYNGITVGVLEGSATRNQLVAFAERNGFSYNEKVYDTSDLVLEALQNGEVDAASVSTALVPSWARVLSLMNLRPFYFVVDKDNAPLLDELNQGISLLKMNAPLLEDKLRKKYFTNVSDGDIVFSSAEKRYIAAASPICVALDPDFMPIEGFNSRSGEPQGYTVELLSLISQITGLSFEFVSTGSYVEAMDMLTHGAADMLSSVNRSVANTLENRMSDLYLSASIVLIGNTDFYPEEGRNVVVAIPPKSTRLEESIAKIYPGCEFKYYDSGREAYDAVSSDEADLVARNIYSAQSELLITYDNLRIVYDIGDFANYRFAFSDDVPDELLSIFNKALSTITEADVNAMLLTASMSQIDTTAATMRAIIAVVIAIIFAVFAAWLTVRLVRARKRLVQMAYYDDLTGLPNLIKFKEEAKAILEDNPGDSYVMMVGDIADFSLINEQLGYNTGDHVLKAVAESIKEICPNNDILLCRVSADTFVWLYNYTRAVARCINPFEQYQANYLTRSDISLEYHVGRYRIPQGYADVDDIYEKTNYVHSFAKKTSKKNSVIDYDEDVQRIRKNNRLIESKMEKALNNHDFKVYLQPKYTCDGTSIAGAEALVRWIDPEAGAMIFPGDFVPLFEQNGFVVRLDLYMFEETCKIIADWKARGLPIVPVSVNFSRLHFLGDGLADALAEIVKRYGVEPEHLEVEITENALSSNHENISRVITRLRELGFKLSMDDFSSQHSSMSFLAYVDFDVVKLDRAFVEPIADNNRCRLLVSGVIDALKKLEISVVAEGIETQAQVVELTRMNCDMIQGYVFARPLPVDEFNELLALSGTTEMH